MFNIDSFGNIYFTGAIAANSYPTITTTPTHVLVAGAGGIISRVAVSQLVSNTQSLSPVTSVFGRTGDIMPSRDDYNSSLIKEGSNLYFTNPRARAAISLTTTGSTGPATYNPVTGVINVPQYQSDLNGVSSFNTRTGAVVLTALDVTTALTYTPLAVETDPVWTAQKILYYTKVETESYVTTQISNLVDSAPTALNTLNELAAALGDDANFSTTVTNLIGTKEPIITPGTTLQYWRGDKTWQTLPIYTLSGLGGVPTSRTLTINGTSYDLSADRSWTINSMVYPSAGIAVSTGTAWATSITDNSTNWNTAYGWGNHASAGYLTTSAAASIYLTQTNASNTYVSLTGAYSNPAFVASLAWSKITGAPSFITSYTETDTLASVTARGASTSTNITLNVVYFSDTTNGIYKSGGRLTVRSESTDNVANFANYGLYLPQTGQTAGLYVESPIEARGGLRIGSNAGSGTITVGADTGVTASRLVQRDGNGYIYANYINFNTSESENPTISSFFTSNGDGWSRKSSIAHVRNQLGNYGGWITGITSIMVTNALGYTPYNSSNPSGYVTSSDWALLGTGISYNNDRTTKVSNGLAIYGAYFGGANSPWTYDLAAQFVTGSRGFELSASWHNPSATLALRTLRDCCDNWSSWVTILSSANYNSYAPSLSGSGATGSWGISITGTAASETLSTVTNRGSTTSTSISAAAFFEISDSRLKTLINDKIDYQSIANVVARYYDKNGKKELGYYAQDFLDILPSAVSKNEEGFLNLSYREVHTAKIAYLEEKIKNLENQLKNALE